jgi:hypothetical protein
MKKNTHTTLISALVGLACALLAVDTARAQEAVEEVVVTGIRGEAGSIPGTSLKRAGDFILLNVGVSNDSRDEKTRREEITATLRAMLAAASKDKSIELSVIDENSLVLPLKLDSATLRLSGGKRPDTSETTISVKTRIPANVPNGSALVAKLRDFVTNTRPVGRTVVDDDGSIVISIVNPAQYRERVIELFAADVRKVTSALGPDYKVVARGIDRPIEWVREGMLEVTIFVPYRYDVIPASVTAYTQGGE